MVTEWCHFAQQTRVIHEDFSMRITIVGGGSYCWTPILLRDILFTPGLEGAEICLEDINKKHLADLMKCSRAIIKQAHASGSTSDV